MNRRPLIWLLAALTLIGCSNSNDVPAFTLPVTSTDVIGTFTLTSSDGVAPPFTAFTTATEQWRLQTDNIVMAPDGTWSETTTYLVFQLSDGSSATQTTIVSGTYVIANGQINFTMTSGGTATFAGAVSGNALILLYNGKQFAYTR
jgi:uncharacterized lipoprotein NlpE involved in copper resistance